MCTFAKDGESCTVDSDVERFLSAVFLTLFTLVCRVIKEFHQAKKPIGLLCVSPVIAAKLFPGVQVTLGNDDKGKNSHLHIIVFGLFWANGKRGSDAVPFALLIYIPQISMTQLHEWELSHNQLA